jgi:hypothetical protein
MLFETQLLATSSEVIKSDGAAYKLAAKEKDKGGIDFVNTSDSKITKHKISGSMSQEIALNYIGYTDKKGKKIVGSIDERLADGDISEGIARQMKRNVIDAFGASVQSGSKVEDDNWFSWDQEVEFNKNVIPYITKVNEKLRAFDEVTSDMDLINEDGGLGPWYQSVSTDLQNMVNEGKKEGEINDYMKMIDDHIQSKKADSYLK